MAESATISCDDTAQKQAAAELLPIVYDNLRRLAAKLIGRQAPGQTLQPTALVHEAFVRLTASRENPSWENCEHFFAAAARAMRCILVDSHRRKCVFQRIVANGRVGTAEECADPPMVDLIALDTALDQLAAEDPIAAKVIEFRFFVGLSLNQTAKALSISRRAVSDKWAFARAWLLLMLEGENAEKSGLFGLLDSSCS